MEELFKNVKLQPRKALRGREHYLEFSESREELNDEYNGGYDKGKWA